MITVVPFSEELTGSTLSGPPHKFLSWWEEKFSLVPPEFANTAWVSCSPIHYDDESLISVEVSYNRPETEEEVASREAANELMKKNVEIFERKQLEKLKAKYESK